MEAALEPRRKRKWWKTIPWSAVIIIGGFAIMAIAAPILTPYRYDQINLSPGQIHLPPAFLEGGSVDHLLGTDHLGRDLLTRLIYGARISLLVALLTVGIAGSIGLALGIVAGYYRGIAATVLDRLMDTTIAVPIILVAMVFVVIRGPSISSVVIPISLLMWARYARIIRGEVLQMREMDFISQAKITGCSSLRIMLRHIAPNVFNTFMVLISLNVGVVILTEATLSFLGAGIPPPYPTWGRLVAEGRARIYSQWWLCVLPGACITLLVLALNVFGNWVRDYLDPKLRQVM